MELLISNVKGFWFSFSVYLLGKNGLQKSQITDQSQWLLLRFRIKDEGDIEHKTSSFADDLLTYITEPSTSILALLDSFKEYGEISGYLTNEARSIAMMLSGDCPRELGGPKNVAVIWAYLKQNYGKLIWRDGRFYH